MPKCFLGNGAISVVQDIAIITSRLFGLQVLDYLDATVKCGEYKTEELLRFYVLKYGYFVRNKYFHAEKADPYFVLKNTSETEEINRLSVLFGYFLADLIRCNHLYINKIK